MAKAKIKVPKKLVKEYRDVETKLMYFVQEANAAKFMGNSAKERSFNREVPKLQDRMEALWNEIDKEVGGGLESIKMLYVKINGKKKFG